MLFDSGSSPPPAGGATVSGCGLYRYALWRSWGDGRTVNFVMLNPSTADASADDNTVKKITRFAKSWGFGGLVVTNLYALRSRDPAALWKAADPVGPENDAFLGTFATRADLVVCAWGNHGAPVWRKNGWQRGRGPVVLEKLKSLGVAPHALRITGESQPEHPLFLPGALTPKPFDDAPGPEVRWVPAGFEPAGEARR
jgi:hypothetical protein